MNCESWTEAIGDLVDGALDERRRRDVEDHLRDCASCRTLAADLRAIRTAASQLPSMQPPERIWQRLSTQLPVGDNLPAADADVPTFWSRIRGLLAPTPRRLAWAGSALVVVLLATAVSVLLLRETGSQKQQATNKSAPVHANDADLVQSVESELRLAEEHYEKAIAGLQQMATAGEGSLDPQLAETLRRNLTVIDNAIKESRVALANQPTNELAQESLFEAFRRKVALLQDTVALINEMRKGNQAEAAKIIGNMNKV